MPSRAPSGWTPDVDRSSGPLYLAIANAIGAAVSRGEIQPGDRLPPHRALAALLDVDLTTVTRAYGEARRRGLLDAGVGRGTFVRHDAWTEGGPDRSTVVDMTMNLPPQPTDPPLAELLQAGMARLLRHQDTATLMTYRAGAGTAQDRAAGAAWLAPVLGSVPAGRVLVCSGAQTAMLAALQTLAGAGDTVAAQSLTYPGFLALAAHLGLVPVGVPQDEEGMLPDALERVCRDRRPKAIFINPTIQNPTAITTSLERRRAVAAIARRHGIPVLEDDAYGLFPDDPLPAIAALAPELTFHVTTTAKTLSPGLRTAFMVVPDAHHAARVGAALRATSMMASPLLTSLVTLWVRDGTAHAVLAGIRREAAARQAVARDLLPAALCRAHPMGLHVWLSLPSHWGRAAFVAYVRHQGLALVPSDAFHVDGMPPNGVRVALGVAPNRERLAEALAGLARALRETAPPLFVDVV